MSVKVMGWVLEHSPVSVSGQRLVLLALADAAREDGTGAWPSQESLARMSRLSERQVRNCLKALEEAGHIVRQGVSQKGTVVWKLVMEGGSPLPGEISSGVEAHFPPDPEAHFRRTVPNPSLTESSPDGEGKSGEVREVFEHWQKVMDKPTAKLTGERRKKIGARLEQGYSVDDIRTAIDGCAASDFHMGRGAGDRTEYNDLELICRNGSKLEMFRDFAAKQRAAQENDKYARFG